MSRSLYAQYILEREDFEIFEDEKGFATFKCTGDECYIRDIFVAKEFRRQAAGTMYADEITKIAKARGCKFLTGTVYPAANGATSSMAALLAYGFKILESRNDRIVLMKEIL